MPDSTFIIEHEAGRVRSLGRGMPAARRGEARTGGAPTVRDRTAAILYLVFLAIGAVVLAGSAIGAFA